jgi:hypothetical protein
MSALAQVSSGQGAATERFTTSTLYNADELSTASQDERASIDSSRPMT